MSQRNLIGNTIFEYFRQYCGAVIPTNSWESEYFHVAVNRERVSEQCEVFGEVPLTAEQISQAQQVVLVLLSTYPLEPDSIYQIEVKSDKAKFEILGMDINSGKVSEVSTGYVSVLAYATTIVVRTNVTYSIDDQVEICYVPLPRLKGEEYSHDFYQPPPVDLYSHTYAPPTNTVPSTESFPPSYASLPQQLPQLTTPVASQDPAIDLLDSQVDVSSINVEEYSDTSGLCRLPIRSLANCSRWNQQLSEKALSLSSRYTHWRKARGDGNCYYRSVAIGYLEHLCRNTTPNDHFAAFYMKLYHQSEIILTEELSSYFKDFPRMLKRLYDDKRAGRGLESLQNYLQDPGFDLGAVATLRGLALYTFTQLLSVPDFSAFLTEGQDRSLYTEIATMGRDAEGLIFRVMANALDIKIVHILLSAATCREESFVPENKGCKVVLHVLLKPGHYDALYPIAVQQLDQYEYEKNAFRNPPVPTEPSMQDYYEEV